MKILKIVDLTLKLTEDTPIYPGDPKPKIETATTIDKEGYNLCEIKIGSQSGSHVDAPYHVRNDGKTLDKIPLDIFLGKAVVIDVTNKGEEEEITPDDIKPYINNIINNTIVLFRTDWYKNIGKPEFFKHPYVAFETAEILIKKGVKFICIDTINVDKSQGNFFPVHHLFSEMGLIIGENMAYFDFIDFDNPYICCLPLNLCNMDGAPARIIAMKLNE